MTSKDSGILHFGFEFSEETISLGKCAISFNVVNWLNVSKSKNI